MKALLVLLLSLMWTGHLCAQTNERLYEDLDFRFVTPGARAIAMGKTFVGLADDATAAYSNPAGLSNLLQQEISLELNSNQIKHERAVTSELAETETFGDRVNTPSFFSYAAPVGNFTFSGFRNVIQDYEESFRLRGRFIPSINRFENGTFGTIDLMAVNYGAGVSYLVSPKFSFGGTIMLSELDSDTNGGTGSPDHPRNTTTTKDRDWTTSAIFGVLFKPTASVSIGAVYTMRSTFELTTQLNGQFLLERGDVINLKDVEKRIDYVIPARLSTGISWKPAGSVTLCMDIGYIRYSQQVTENFLVLDFLNQLSAENYYIEDVVEVHAGAEYRLYRREATWAFRGGFFTDPRHPLRFQRLPGTPDFPAAVESFRFNRLPAETDFGATVGAGVALANRVQVDFAFSWSRDSEEAVLSFVWKL